MSQQIQITGGAKVRNLEGVLTGTSGVVNSLGINVPSGIPQLDGSGKILVSQLPNSVMEYKGTWNAATNTPTLVNGTGNQGDVYLCNVAGTVNFGAGPITFSVGDQVIYSGTIWQRASGATGTVTSVAVTESGDALTITGSPITTSGTINIGFAGTSGQYVNGAGGLTTFPSLTGFVPYTGATSDVNLGTFGLLGDYIGFNTSPTSVPTALGTLSWDTTYRTLQLIDGDGDTTLQIGQEQRALIHNNTGSTLTDGQVVYVTGSTGNLPSVALASNAIEATSSVTFGVVTETIANGADGFVTISGMVNGLNTLAFNEGDALYLGATAGTFTNVKPTAPANLVLIGYMIKKAGGNGSIFVKIQNGYELEELHDVSVTSVANNEGIFWDSATSLWKNKSIATALGYTPADDSLVVKLAGTQTITGIKTFTSEIRVNTTDSTGGVLNLKRGTFIGPIPNYTSIFSEGDELSIASQGTSTLRYAKFDLASITSGATRTYTLPDASGTIALTSDLSAYVTLATAQTISGAKTFSAATKIDGSLLLKDAAAITTASGYAALNFVKSTSQSSLYLSSDTGFTSALNFVNTSSYNYFFPATSGTIALTSNLSSYLPLSGGTLTGDLTIDKSSASLFLKSATGGSNSIAFLVNGVSVGAISVTSTFYQFNNNTSYGFLFKNSGGSNLLSIQDSGAAVFLGSVSATIGDFSSWVKSTGYRLDGMTAGSSALYYNAAANRVTLANYNASGILTFETNGGATALTLSSTGAATFSSSVGINTTPVSSTGSTRTLQIGGSTIIQSVVNNQSLYGDNAYYDGSGWKYATSNNAAAMRIGALAVGDFTFHSAAYATAGSSIPNWDSSDIKMTIKASGNVGIGTSSPDSGLNINSGATRGLRIDTNSGVQGFSMSPNCIFGIDEPGVGNGRFIINTNGNVGIGTSSPSYALQIKQPNAGQVGILSMAYGNGNGIYIGHDGTIGVIQTSYETGAYTDLTFKTSGSERMRILANGITLIYSVYSQTSGSAANVIVGSDGNLFRSTSSLKYKKNVNNYTKGLAEVMKLRPVTYEGKNEMDNGKTFAGLIAEEIHDLGLTEFVQYAEDGSPDALSYQNMVSLLVKAIQEQQAQIEELKAKIK